METEVYALLKMHILLNHNKITANYIEQQLKNPFWLFIMWQIFSV